MLRYDLQNPSPQLLLWAYRRGVFPMADPDRGLIDWFSPDPRGILPLVDFHVPRNVARLVRRERFRITSNQCFEEVMRQCAQPRRDDSLTWIDERLIRAYTGLHDQGHAHSVEAWRGGTLVGGLYGVHVGSAFFGESMFTRPTLGGSDSSKVCLVHLADHLRIRGFTLLDTQFWNEHLDQFGCIEISREQYLDTLAAAIELKVEWNWTTQE